jgi:hypothetical protein
LNERRLGLGRRVLQRRILDMPIAFQNRRRDHLDRRFAQRRRGSIDRRMAERRELERRGRDRRRARATPR